MLTARDLANLVRDARKSAWEKSDPTIAIVATKQLNSDDEREIRRVVAKAGFIDQKLEEMVQQVAALLIGQIEAQDDDIPAVGGD